MKSKTISQNVILYDEIRRYIMCLITSFMRKDRQTIILAVVQDFG